MKHITTMGMTEITEKHPSDLVMAPSAGSDGLPQDGQIVDSQRRTTYRGLGEDPQPPKTLMY